MREGDACWCAAVVASRNKNRSPCLSCRWTDRLPGDISVTNVECVRGQIYCETHAREDTSMQRNNDPETKRDSGGGGGSMSLQFMDLRCEDDGFRAAGRVITRKFNLSDTYSIGEMNSSSAYSTARAIIVYLVFTYILTSTSKEPPL